MAKRVKKGTRIKLPAVGGRLAREAVEEDGDLVVLPVGGGVSWNLCPQHCEALGMTAVLEDVPEPWERVRDAWFAAVRSEMPDRIPASTKADDVIWRHMAESLGIKSEGE